MKVVFKNCDKELGGELKFSNKNHFKSSFENLKRSFSFREIYVKYSEKDSIQLWFIAIRLSFHYHPVKSIACDTHSIHLLTFD